MIIPSIDLMGGHAVQLIGGKEKAIDAGDPFPILKKFSLVGDVAVIDLDAALGQGNNTEIIKQMCAQAKVRVGGGIRSLEAALDWLDAGAEKIILGTAAKPELLSKLPKERVMAALDAVDGEVVIHGWQTKTGKDITSVMRELEDYVSGFLITFVEREGRMTGIDSKRITQLISESKHPITFAGGVSSAEDVAEIDKLGADSQVGMALYSGKIDLADCIAASLSSDRPDKLWPTVVADEFGTALGLCYSNIDSLRHAIESGKGTYHSRKRGLWIKGESSGAAQELKSISLDCDRDTLLFKVHQTLPGFCHLKQWSCWGSKSGLPKLEDTLNARRENAPKDSYTARLFSDSELLNAKLLEEAKELVEAETEEDICWEAADVIYFTMVKLAANGLSLSDIEKELKRRSLKVRRRGGERKDK